MALEPLETADGSDFPYCRQLSIFAENRLGQLHRLTRLFEHHDIHILAVSVDGSVDCAIIRLIVDRADEAYSLLRDAGFAASETEVLVVELPPGRRGITSLCAALIAAEVNINYIYALLPSKVSGPCVALQVDNSALAAAVLRNKNFRVIDQSEL